MKKVYQVINAGYHHYNLAGQFTPYGGVMNQFDTEEEANAYIEKCGDKSILAKLKVVDEDPHRPLALELLKQAASELVDLSEGMTDLEWQAEIEAFIETINQFIKREEKT